MSNSLNSTFFAPSSFSNVELLIQNKNFNSDIDSFCKSMKKILQHLSDIYDFNWNFNEKKIDEFNKKISEIIQKNPSLGSEIKKIFGNYE